MAEQWRITRRRRAHLAAAWNAASLAIPGALGAATSNRLTIHEVLGVEFAGNGQRLLDLADGRGEALQRFRRVLGRNDNYYTAWYGTGLLVGASLLPRPWALLGAAVIAIAVAADVAENLALDQALTRLLADPDHPDLVDAAARRAHTAATVKFLALVPSLSLCAAGVGHGLRARADDC